MEKCEYGCECNNVTKCNKMSLNVLFLKVFRFMGNWEICCLSSGGSARSSVRKQQPVSDVGGGGGRMGVFLAVCVCWLKKIKQHQNFGGKVS